MRLLLWPIIFALLTACASQSDKPLQEQSVRQLQADLTSKHPSAYIHLARELFERGKKDEAARMYYVGQIRYRAYINTLSEAEAQTEEEAYEQLKATIGDDINQYAAQDLDNWVQLLDSAVEWHHQHPNEFLPKDKFTLLYEITIYNFNKLRDYVADNKEFIRQQRAAQGLPNK